jgi:flagellar hook-associated protein 3 FlgL
MRVGTAQVSQIALQGLQAQDKKYADLMVQMSSGNRINKISDDPMGSVQLMGFAKEEANFTQWKRNSENVISNLEKSEGYMDNSFNVLLRAQDLVLMAVDGSASQVDRESSVAELREIKNTLVSFANAKDGNGSYIFSGSRTATPPVFDTGSGYVYQGDSLTRDVPVSEGRSIAGNETVEDIFFGGAISLFDNIDAFISDVDSGSATIGATGPDLLDGIKYATNKIGETLTSIGGKITSANDTMSAQADLSLANGKIVGRIRDLDYAEATIEMNKVELALTTTQKAYSKVSQLSLFNYL